MKELHIDAFSNPVLTQALEDLIKISSTKAAQETRWAHEASFEMNRFWYKVETYLVSCGAIKDAEKAHDMAFELDEENFKINVINKRTGEREGSYPFSIYPKLRELNDELSSILESRKLVGKQEARETTNQHNRIWDSIYAELVRLGHYPTAEAAKKNEFKFDNGRCLVKKDSVSADVKDRARDFIKKFLGGL